MYFLLANLSFIDLCLSTLMIPKKIHDLHSGHKTISFQGCVIHLFVFHVLGGSEMVLLIAWSWIAYVAICKPLHYLTIMSPQMWILLLSGAWAVGLIHSVAQLAFVVHLTFCGPNEIDSFCFETSLVHQTCLRRPLQDGIHGDCQQQVHFHGRLLLIAYLLSFHPGHSLETFLRWFV